MGEQGVTPGLGTILVGDDPPSHAYVRLKREDSAEIGVRSVHTELPATVSQQRAARRSSTGTTTTPTSTRTSSRSRCPTHLDAEAALLAIDPDKDADGLHPVNLGKLVMGVAGAPRPCTPLGIQALLVMYNVPIEGQHVVIIGRGHHDRPAAREPALAQGAERERDRHRVSHGHRTSCPSTRKEADIIVAAAGRPSILTPDMVRPGAAVVGPGATMQGRKVVPDVDEACAEVAGWITPRLGGVGPTTRAMLLRQTVETAERRAGDERDPMTAAPQAAPHCAVCGAPVAADAPRCPSCGLSRPAATGAAACSAAAACG